MNLACAVGRGRARRRLRGTDRYQRDARTWDRARRIRDMLGLDADARVLEVRQYLAPERARWSTVPRALATRPPRCARWPSRSTARCPDEPRVAARSASASGARRRSAGCSWRRGPARPRASWSRASRAATRTPIRFFVALEPDFEIAGVRVVEHEEDPGLGAEVATPGFQGQFLGRAAESSRPST